MGRRGEGGKRKKENPIEKENALFFLFKGKKNMGQGCQANVSEEAQ